MRNFIASPSVVIIDEIEFDLHHDWEFRSFIIECNGRSVFIEFEFEERIIRISMKSPLRVYSSLPSDWTIRRVGVLTMIGWVHLGYPDDYDTFSISDDIDENWDLSIVLDDSARFKFGGGQLHVSIRYANNE